MFKLSVYFISLCCVGLVTLVSGIPDCSNSRYFIRTFGVHNTPKSPVQGNNLQVCSKGLTCCTEEMEQKMWATSRKQFNKAMTDSISDVKSFFANRAYKFDDFFIDLLATSKIKFHALFQKLYGIIYERNSDVFIDFFRDLQDYYNTGEVDLEDALKRFFEQLYQRMFEVFNSHHDFDKTYLSCVSTTMRKLQPFGNVPKKLTEQLRRSFVATRTFSQGLLEGKKIAYKIMKLTPRDQCLTAWMKMSNCPSCQGYRSYQHPCENYCLNVMRGCLAYYSELGDSWNKFVVAIQNVTDRLVGLFDIERVVEPIGVKISDAIMNFQNNGFDVSVKVYDECGTPRIHKRGASNPYRGFSLASRSKRSYTNEEDMPEVHSDFEKEDTKLKILIREIKESIWKTHGFWEKLPGDICNKDRHARRDKCWNGSDIGIYKHPLIPAGLQYQDNNPEVSVDATKPDININEQILALKLITKKLENAADGAHVSWDTSPYNIESPEPINSGDCENTDDEDCYTSADYDYYGYSGSGSGEEDGRVHSYNEKTDNYDINEEDEDAEENWPPWVTPKSQVPKTPSIIVTTSKPKSKSSSGTTSSGSRTRVPKSLKGLLYYLVPLFTCLLGNAISVSW